MKIIVNDANILIDLVELKILSYFFQLEFEFHATALVFEELAEEQKEKFYFYIETGKLIIDNNSESDLSEINIIQKGKSTLSVQDCSAFYQAKKGHAALITSDNSLRKFAKINKIEVHGHLWVFDNLFEKSILSGITAIEKLNELCNTVNPKLGLPKKECQTRIKLWSK